MLPTKTLAQKLFDLRFDVDAALGNPHTFSPGIQVHLEQLSDSLGLLEADLREHDKKE